MTSRLLDTFADYQPKAFYTIDENGNVSPVHPISEVKIKTLT